MTAKGFKSDQSVTLSSASLAQGLSAVKPDVQIIAPEVIRSAQQLQWSIGFAWTHDVRNFDAVDAEGEPEDIFFTGDIEGATLTDFGGGDNLYSAILTLPANAHGTIGVSVRADAANGNGTTGPEFSVGVAIPFDTRPNAEPTGITCRRSRPVGLNRDLLPPDDRTTPGGGVYRNIFSSAKLGDYIYFVCQIQRHGGLWGASTPTTSGILTFLDRGATFFIAAGAVLYRVNVKTCVFEILKRYENITFAARSLVAINGRVYGFEGSHYNFINDGLVINRETGVAEYRRSRFRDVDDDWRQQCGNLISIANDETEITSHGIWTSAAPIENPYYDQENPDAFYGIHTGTASPIVASADDIRLVTGYGDYRKVVSDDPEEETQRYGNVAWLQFDTELKRRIPILETNNRTIYDIIREIARLTNSIISFDGETFTLKPRDTDAPAQYSLDLNAHTLEQPIEDITPYTDKANRYNSIVINYGEGKQYRKSTPTANADGVKEYAIDTPWGEENIAWIRQWADAFLARFSVTRHIVVIQLKPSMHLKLGNIVEINAAERVHLSGRYQVIEATHFIPEKRTEARFVSL